MYDQLQADLEAVTKERDDFAAILRLIRQGKLGQAEAILASDALAGRLGPDYREQLAQSQARLQELENERDQAKYIPGSWTCTQCEFGQVISTLYLQSGTIGANTDEVPVCPNDGSIMRRCTWKERLKDYDTRLGQELDLVDRLKARVQELEAELIAWKHSAISADAQEAEINTLTQRIQTLEVALRGFVDESIPDNILACRASGQRCIRPAIPVEVYERAVHALTPTPDAGKETR